jgi:hypothetical protein
MAGGITAADPAVTTISHHQACGHFVTAAAPPTMMTPTTVKVTGQRGQRDRSPVPLIWPPAR